MKPASFNKLSVVVACFNEEANLKRFPAEVFPVLKECSHDFELVLIDDGSSDHSLKVMENLRSQFPAVVVIKHSKNLGLGAALRAGFDQATGDAILTMDADLTFHPRELPPMLQVYDGQTDCVMGSPFLGAMQGVSLLRRFLSWGVNTVYRILLGVDVSSVSSIFRLYRASVLRTLSLTRTSFDINAEILFQILAVGGVVREVPVTLGTRIYGESKINTVREIKNHLRMFGRILQWKTQKPK